MFCHSIFEKNPLHSRGGSSKTPAYNTLSSYATLILADVVASKLKLEGVTLGSPFYYTRQDQKDQQ
jgi:hypothetical protein